MATLSNLLMEAENRFAQITEEKYKTEIDRVKKGLKGGVEITNIIPETKDGFSKFYKEVCTTSLETVLQKEKKTTQKQVEGINKAVISWFQKILDPEREHQKEYANWQEAFNTIFNGKKGYLAATQPISDVYDTKGKEERSFDPKKQYLALAKAMETARGNMADEIYKAPDEVTQIDDDPEVIAALGNMGPGGDGNPDEDELVNMMGKDDKGPEPDTQSVPNLTDETQSVSSLTDKYLIEYTLCVKQKGTYVRTTTKGTLNDYLTSPDKTTVFGKKTPENSVFYDIESILAKDSTLSDEHGRFEIATKDEQQSKKGDLIYCDESGNHTGIKNYKNKKISIKNERVVRTLVPDNFEGNECKSSVRFGNKYALLVSLKIKDASAVREIDLIPLDKDQTKPTDHQ